MFKKDFEVSILVNGKPVQEYIKEGKIYIEGRKDTAYSIKIKNKSCRRIVAVPTVDGLSVINGKEASYDSTGYVVNSYDSITIDGWRKSDKEVAQFYFSSMGKSYTAKMNKGGNQGVIGIAVYKEKEKEMFRTTIYNIVEKPVERPRIEPLRPNHPWWFETTPSYPDFPSITCSSFNAEAGSGSSCFTLNSNPTNAGDDMMRCSSKKGKIKSRQKLGTGWGDTRKSETVNVSFERDNDTLTVFEFFYNTRNELIKKGIDLKKKPIEIEEPRAFPRSFCEPPRD